MEFPFWIEVATLRLHPHFVLEALAYFVGFRWYLARRRMRGDPLPSATRWWIVVAAILGAAAGSKLLYWLNDPAATWAHRADPAFWLGGKTIVGGILGGWIAVELAKRRLQVAQSTGDLFAAPLALGIAIGRIGCFLTGLEDNTHGVATTLPWGVNFGDGITRHPTQLYEILFLVGLLMWLKRAEVRPHVQGDLFKTFALGYLTFRFLVEFLKPEVGLIGLSGIQWASLAGLLYMARHIPRLLGRRTVSTLA